MKISKTFHPEKLSNGETILELLTRSRYLLVINPDKWNEYQTRRAILLYEKFPQLKQAFDIISSFRDWYKPKPIYNEPFENERVLGNWIDEIEKCNTTEMKNFKNLDDNHFERIMNYHRFGHKTNAITESVNAKIKDAIRRNNGTRYLDFFHFRIAIII